MINQVLRAISFVCLILSSYCFYLGFTKDRKVNFTHQFTHPFSPNSLCNSLSLTQNSKNDCLRTFGFKDTNRPPIRIAVIDTGIDNTHPYLRKYISPVGYDIYDYSNAFKDEAGHGTHVSGIIVQQIEAISDATQTIIPFELIAVKYTDRFNSTSMSTAILHVISKEKVDILNISSVGKHVDYREMMALNIAADLGIQVVSASGNEGENITFTQNGYPCKYALENIICVANLNVDGSLNASSNFGQQVDVAAVGTNILSTLPNYSWGYMTGTSMAVPRVTALVAYLKSQNLRKDFYSKEEIASLGDVNYPRNGIFKSAILNFTEVAKRAPAGVKK